MNNYQRNMECLKIYNRYIYDKLIKVDSLNLSNKLDEIQSVESKDGNKVINIIYQGKEYRLNSIYRPKEEAEKWASQFALKDGRNILTMYGLGNGMFSRALLNFMGDEDRLLIYEPCYNIFEHTLNHYDIEDIISDKRTTLVVEGLNDDLLNISLQKIITLYNFGSQLQYIYPNYDNIFRDSCIDFYKKIKESIISARININTNVAFGARSVENVIKNLRFFINSNALYELKEKIPKDIPAIVIAAGPSLADNIDWIKKAKGKSVIFAVERALDYLLDEGIEPDFVVTIDPRKDKKYFSSREDITIPLISFVESNYEILEHHKGRKIFVTSFDFVDSIYSKLGKKTPGLVGSGSVAIVAYSACVELGFQRIALVGQELAYRGDSSHVGGQKSTIGDAGNVYVEDLEGNLIKSRYDWKDFILRYQDLINIHKDVEVIDVKECGAKIKGTTSMLFPEVLDKYCTKEFHMGKVLSEVNFMFDADDSIKIKDILNSHVSELKKIKEKANKGIKLCEKQLNRIKRNTTISNDFEVANNKLYNINSFMQNQNLYSIIDSFIVSEASTELSKVLQFSGDTKENQLNTYEHSKTIYKAIIKGTDVIKEHMDVALSNFYL